MAAAAPNMIAGTYRRDPTSKMKALTQAIRYEEFPAADCYLDDQKCRWVRLEAIRRCRRGFAAFSLDDLANTLRDHRHQRHQGPVFAIRQDDAMIYWVKPL